MALSSGTWVGPYEVQAAICAGGMGEVNKAGDTNLDRIVTIKLPPSELNADPGRRVRFERESKTVAALSHPHSCALHDVGASFVPIPRPLAAGHHSGRMPGSGSLGLSSVDGRIATEVQDHSFVMEHLQGLTLDARFDQELSASGCPNELAKCALNVPHPARRER